MSKLALAGIAFLISGGVAWADVPVGDAANLDQKTQTSATTVKLVPITQSRSSTNGCVHKAVTTGKKAPASDPSIPANVAAGQNTVQQFDPGSNLASPSGSTAGVGEQGLVFGQVSGVAGGVSAGQGTVTATDQVYQGLTSQAGTAGNVQQAFDMNSGIRVQNVMAWNNAISAMNLLSQAWNIWNIAANSDTSQSGLALKSPVPPGTSMTTACPPGMTGLGTALSPCASAACVPVVSASTTDTTGCVTRRYIDTAGNVEFYLTNSQFAFSATSTAPATAVASPVTTAEVAAALQQYQIQH